jgi:WS/DGAT/MGAT family acyltransferase
MSAARKDSEKFSSVDTAWLRMGTPTNLAVITGVLAFNAPLDLERLQATIENRLLTHRRFRQRVREPNLPLGLPEWEYDPGFNLDNHLQRVSLPEPGGHDALQELVSDLMSQPLDPDKPLWKFHLVENYGQGSALICRLHHCIADGMALVKVLLSATDEEADAPTYEPTHESEQELGRFARLLLPAVKAAAAVGDTWRTTSHLVHEGMEALTHPQRWWDAAKMGTSASRALGKLLLLGPDRRTVLRGKCDIPKRAAWSKTLKLEDVKSIGRLMGGTINDILISAVTGALRRYLEERGEPVLGLNIRAIVPVNLRPPEDEELVGNRFGLVFLSLPVGVEDPLKRLVVLRRRMNAIKDSPEAVVAFGILAAMGMSPSQIENIIVTIFGMKGTAVMTNVPGPRRPLYMAGVQIDSLMFWVPTPGNLGLGVSIVSYAGEIILGVASDEGLVPDPESLLRHFHQELEQMKRWGRPPARKSAPPTKEPAKQDKTRPEVSTKSPSADSSPFLRCQALTKSGKPCKNRARPGEKTCHVHRNSE